MKQPPPLIPFYLYESLTWLTGRHSERLRLWFSTLIGRQRTRTRVAESQYWLKFEAFRTASSICDPTAVWLWRSLSNACPKVIVEFGTGFSTFVIASFAEQRFLADQQKPAVISLEHNTFWFGKQQRLLAEANLCKTVHLIHSVIGKQAYFGNEVMCYRAAESAVSVAKVQGGADFVFVDGPPATVYGGVGRHGSILQAVSICKQGGTILIHDALRKEEYSAIRAFNYDRRVPFACYGIVPVRNGLAICKKAFDEE